MHRLLLLALLVLAACPSRRGPEPGGDDLDQARLERNADGELNARGLFYEVANRDFTGGALDGMVRAAFDGFPN